MKTINISELPYLPLSDKSLLPKTSGIYFVIDGDTVLYIGKAINIWQRWQGHHRYQQIAILYPNSRIAWLDIVDCSILLKVETALIETFHPSFNGDTIPPEYLDKERISLYVEPEKKEELKRLAKKRKRSLNSMIDVIFDEVLEQAKKDGEL